MRKVVDEVLEEMDGTITYLSVVLSETFMMPIFDSFVIKLPPFRDYMQQYVSAKQMFAGNKATVICVNYLSNTRRELLNPELLKKQQVHAVHIGVGHLTDAIVGQSY